MIKSIKKSHKNDDIFHYLDVINVNEQEYSFVLRDKYDPLRTLIYNSEKCDIPDPSIDSNFKAIFINKPNRFENFLNSVHFWPNGMEISHIEFLIGDFNTIGYIYNLNTLRADIVCKGIIKIRDENYRKETLLDVEIQINWIPNLDDHLFEYGSLLRNTYSDQIAAEKRKNKDKDKKRVYLNTLVIALILGNQNNNSNDIKLTKNELGQNPYELNNFKIVEINLFREWNSIHSTGLSQLYPNNLSKDRKDWIKLICLRMWAKKKEGYPFAKYEFPKLLSGDKYSTNQFIDEAIHELINGNRMINLLYEEVEITMEAERNKGIEIGVERGKKNDLVNSFFFFLRLGDLNNFNFESKYNSKEVMSILSKKIDTVSNIEAIQKFIEALRKKGVIIE